MNLWVLDVQMGFGKMSHFHHEFIPSLSLSEPGRPLHICAIQLEPVSVSKPSDGAFILPFYLWLALVISSTLLFCQKGVFHLLCLAFQQSSVVTAVLYWPRGLCHLNSPNFHSPGTIHLVCNPNFLSTLPPITNISNSKAFSHTGWKQWPFPLDRFCLQLFILFLHVKVLA